MPSRGAHFVCARCGGLLRASQSSTISAFGAIPTRTVSNQRPTIQAQNVFKQRGSGISTRNASDSQISPQAHETEIAPGSFRAGAGQPQLGRYSRKPLKPTSYERSATSPRPSGPRHDNGLEAGNSAEQSELPQFFRDIIPSRRKTENGQNPPAGQSTSHRDLRNSHTTGVEKQRLFRPHKHRLPKAYANTHNETASTEPINSGFQVRRELSLEGRSLESRLVVQIGRAIEAQNATLLQKVLQEMKSSQAAASSSDSIQVSTYEHLMRACMTLRLPRLAIEAWDAMTEAGFKPTVKTWTIMIRGASRMAQPGAIHQFWTGMLDSGIIPDVAAWSARIFALIDTKQPDRALDALNEMGRTWNVYERSEHFKSLQATPSQDRVYSAAKPDISVANAAIAAYSASPRGKAFIPRVLTWAGEYGLAPDVTTFNVLINISLRDGDVDEALVILKQMKARNVEPDSQTLTVVLTKLFYSNELNGVDHETQTAYLMNFINDLEKNHNNARLDAKGYAMAIDRMLKHHNNKHAAHALLTKMRAQNLRPTPHIYTVLLTHHLSTDPPNYAAAESLWVDISFAEKGYGAKLDAVFCDRALELFAPHHSVLGISKLLEVLEHIKTQGKQPSWPALHAVAKAFAERKDTTRLASLVDDIRFSRGVVAPGVSQSYGQLDFWQYILSTGILDEQEIFRVEQLIQQKKK